MERIEGIEGIEGVEGVEAQGLEERDRGVEAVLVGLVVDSVGLAVRGLILKTAGDLERLVLGAGVGQHRGLLLLVAVALLVTVVVAVDADVVVLLLFCYRDAAVLVGTVELGCGQRGHHQHPQYEDLPTDKHR
jgi:hypothetical protein